MTPLGDFPRTLWVYVHTWHGADSRDGAHIVRMGWWVWGALTGAPERTAGGSAGGQQAGRREATCRP